MSYSRKGGKAKSQSASNKPKIINVDAIDNTIDDTIDDTIDNTTITDSTVSTNELKAPVGYVAPSKYVLPSETVKINVIDIKNKYINLETIDLLEFESIYKNPKNDLKDIPLGYYNDLIVMLQTIQLAVTTM